MGNPTVVTGASRGIGREIAQKLAGEGASVVVNYRSSKERAESVVDEIRMEGGEAVTVQADVSNYDEVVAIVNATVEEFGSLDILVNNAGIVITESAEEFDIDDWRRVIDIDLTGTFICSQIAAQDCHIADYRFKDTSNYKT
ncbi:SDR family NAD(P)-dependent oxidoreductase [Haloarcula amylovorans]|uniref:SDR family NAD(P)-dependent oxidoreductase n=1 Tax=Haloarcula amylovorans TaxID=2562280 RepID=UPI00107625AC|nr:SDR family NAD(P)-dependent oxidoreductase [Halomicroarcula amylolytica]